MKYFPSRFEQATSEIFDTEPPPKKYSEFYFKVNYNQSYASPEACILNDCEDNPVMIELLPEEQKTYQHVNIFDEKYTILNNTKIKLIKSNIIITAYSLQSKKTHGGDYFNSYVTDGDQVLVAHEIKDLFNGNYLLKQKCRIESDKDFKLFILAERGAEQIQFYRKLLRANKQYFMNWLIDRVSCSILPYRKNMIQIQVGENFIYCDRKIDPTGKLVESEYRNFENLENLVRNNFKKLNNMIFQEASFICENGTTANIYPDRQSCHFTTIKLNGNEALPICDHQNSGSNRNGQVDVDKSSLAKNLVNKQVFWLYMS